MRGSEEAPGHERGFKPPASSTGLGGLFSPPPRSDARSPTGYRPTQDFSPTLLPAEATGVAPKGGTKEPRRKRGGGVSLLQEGSQEGDS